MFPRRGVFNGWRSPKEHAPKGLPTTDKLGIRWQTLRGKVGFGLNAAVQTKRSG